MFKRILVPLDGSRNAETILPWVEGFVPRERASLLLLRVVDVSFLLEGEAEEIRSEAREYLGRSRMRLERLGPVETVVAESDDPASRIVEVAQGKGCDLIAMATRGGARVERWLVGGVTEQVIRASPIPVLVNPGGAAPERRRGILVPVDGSALSESTVPAAEHLARLFAAPLRLLHVVPHDHGWAKELHETVLHNLGERMDSYCATLETRGLEATFEVTHGDPAKEIIRAAHERAELIVMATHGHGGVKRWILGSVAESVIHRSEIPVFVFKSALQPARPEAARSRVDDHA